MPDCVHGNNRCGKFICECKCLGCVKSDKELVQLVAELDRNHTCEFECDYCGREVDSHYIKAIVENEIDLRYRMDQIKDVVSRMDETSELVDELRQLVW